MQDKPIPIKRWIILGICGAFLTLTLKTCSQVADEKWQEESSIYDIQKEVQRGRFSVALYGFALKIGLSDDNWALQPLIAYNNNLYQAGLSKIPENDSERFRLWYQYKYWPYSWSNPEKYAPEIIPESLKVFESLSKQTSRSPYFNDIEQYYTALNIVYDFFRYVNLTEKPTKERNKAYISITSWLIKNCSNLNPELFLKIRITNGISGVPLDCLRWKIKYMEYDYKNGLLCNEISTKSINDDYKKIREMVEGLYIPRYNGKSQPGVLQDVVYMLSHQTTQEQLDADPNHCKEL